MRYLYLVLFLVIGTPAYAQEMSVLHSFHEDASMEISERELEKPGE